MISGPLPTRAVLGEDDFEGPSRRGGSAPTVLGEDEVERIDGGKLRCTGATWSDAVVVLPDQVLTLSNHERQVHIGRGHRAAERPSTPPIS
jgi:hypothetical protein